MTAKSARRMIRNSRRLYIPSLVGFLCCIADRAFAAGAGMPWEGPIMQIVSSLTGPVAKGIGIVAIAGSGFGLAMSEGGHGARKIIGLVLGLSILFTAATWASPSSDSPAAWPSRPRPWRRSLKASRFRSTIAHRADPRRRLASQLRDSAVDAGDGRHPRPLPALVHPHPGRVCTCSSPHLAKRDPHFFEVFIRALRAPATTRTLKEPIHVLPPRVPPAHAPTARSPSLGRLVDAGVVLQKDGLLQKTLAFRGPDLASSSPSELVSAIARLNNALRRFGSGWTLFVEAQRASPATIRAPPGPTPQPGSSTSSAAKTSSGRRALRVDLLPHLRLGPPVGRRAGAPRPCSTRTPTTGTRNDHASATSHSFEKTVAELADIMAGVFAEVRELDDDETLTYLHSTISTNRHPVAARRRRCTSTASSPTWRSRPATSRCWATTTSRPARSLRFPPRPIPDPRRPQSPALEYRWVTRFIFLDKEDATDEIEKYRKRWFEAQGPLRRCSRSRHEAGVRLRRRRRRSQVRRR